MKGPSKALEQESWAKGTGGEGEPGKRPANGVEEERRGNGTGTVRRALQGSKCERAKAWSKVRTGAVGKGRERGGRMSRDKERRAGGTRRGSDVFKEGTAHRKVPLGLETVEL